MSYSEISKRIGWDDRHVPVPTEEETRELIKKAQNKDENSFEKLFLIVRFAKPNNKANQLIKSEKRRITILRKYDSRITGNFITVRF